MKRLVQWTKASTDRYGMKCYHSQDGRFTIRRREYQLPVRGVGYDVEDRGRRIDRCYTLAEAKDTADDVVQDERTAAEVQAMRAAAKPEDE